MSVEHLSRDDVITVSRLADHLHLSGAFVTIETIANGDRATLDLAHMIARQKKS